MQSSTWQRLKNIGLVTGSGGRFMTRRVTQSGVLQQTLPATSLLKIAVLYTQARDKGLQQRARHKGL